MIDIHFLGAAGTVTGSCYLLERGNFKLLVDCGLFQGPTQLEERNWEVFPFHGHELSSVLLTHAHLDHIGRLPLLVKRGYAGDLYATQPTIKIAEIALRDAAKIQVLEHASEALYDHIDTETTIDRFRTVSWRQTLSIGPFDVEYYPAGHILGAASILVTERSSQKRILFSGDLGRSREELIQPWAPPSEADIVIMESTYGDSMHEHTDINSALALHCDAILENGGTVLIPSFSIERTQELLHRFDHLKKSGRLPNSLPIILDSPMAIHVTSVFKMYSDYFSDELKYHNSIDNPFDFPGYEQSLSGKDSALLRNRTNPQVIVAGSGMMTGGRILAHAAHYLPQATTRLVFVGYQGNETLGRELLDGAKKVMIDGSQITVKATVDRITGLSSHADSGELVNWLAGISGIKKVILTHGDDIPRQELRNTLLKRKPGLVIHLPDHREHISV